MENFLTPILDSWSKYKAEKLVILGNGESRSDGQDFAKQQSLPVVSINTLETDLPVIFTVVTRPGMVSKLESNNPIGIPLVVPSGFPSSLNSVSLPVSEFEYIEGLSAHDSNRVGFREDFVLITILDLLNIAALSREAGDLPLEIHLFGFDFQIPSNNERRNEDLFLESLLTRQRSLFEILLKQDRPFENLTLVNHSRVTSSTNLISAKQINKEVPYVSRESFEAAIVKNVELQQKMFIDANKGEVQIIAELTNNHLGDTDRLAEMVRLCKSQGASVIKVQKRDINVLYTQ